MSEARYFEVKQTRSAAGQPGDQRKTLLGLGLTRIGKTVHLKDTPAIRGMIFKVVHMVQVTPKEGEPPASTRAKARQARA